MDNLIDQGVALAGAGRLNEAADCFRQALLSTTAAPAAHNNLGNVLRAQGRFDEAVHHFMEALRLKPDYAEAHNNLGITRAQQGNLAEAVACCDRALRCNPEFVDAHFNRGLSLSRQGKSTEAEGSFRAAVRLRPNHAAALYRLAMILAERGEREQAADCLRRSVQARPTAQTWNGLGMVLGQQGKAPEAIEAFHAALRMQPGNADTYHNLGIVLSEQGRLDEAIGQFQEAARLRPDHSAALNNLGHAWMTQGKRAEACSALRSALRHSPDFLEARVNLGIVLLELNQPEEAASHFEAALRLKPDHAEACSNLGVARGECGDLAGAIACYEQALRMKPDYPGAHQCRALAWLAQGELEKGWAEYEYRWQVDQVPRPFPQPRWDGGPLTGRTILLHAEQGLGDTIQFIRYAALVKRRGARVIFECPALLVDLLARCPGIDQTVPAGSPLPPFDVHAPLLSLPGIVQTRMNTIPAETPYVFPDADLVNRRSEFLKNIPGFKVGIVWQGGKQYKGDRLRSIALRCFAPLAQVPGVSLLSLQKGLGTEQLAEVAGQFPVQDLAPGAFTDTAAIIQNLDLVIACDTSVAHLAGALRVPVWVAVPLAADWRWFRGRSDSPWYPSLRLFRQRERGNWERVFADMAAALAERVGAPPPIPVAPPVADEWDALNDRGVSLARDGKLVEAADCFRQGLEHRPDGPAAHNNLGNVLRAQGRLDEAAGHYEQALRSNPDYAEAHNNLGIVRAQQGHLDDAIACCDRALRCNPQFADAHFNRGLTLSRQNKHDEAELSFRAAVRLQPNHGSAHYRLGIILADRKQFEEAAAFYQEALRVLPNHVAAHNNLGVVLTDLGRLEEAVHHLQQALRLKPDYAEVYSNLGIARGEQGDRMAALAGHDRALELKPSLHMARYNRALVRLTLGDLEQGWPEYECRWDGKTLAERTYPQPRWNGELLNGRTILLHTEQGLGDTIHFIRYAALVKPRVGRVVFECQAPLLGLLAGCRGIDQIVPAGAPLPAFDAHASLLSLPGIFRTTLTTIPADIPYIFPDPALVQHRRTLLGTTPAFKVGIAWQGSTLHRRDRHRSIALRQFAPLARVPGVRLLSVQKGLGTEQLNAVDFPVQDLQPGEFTDTAAILQNLDLVIAADTAVVHLAVALGVPVWVAVPFAPDWRWLLERCDSPWYPTMRLFRQKVRDHWEQVFAEMAAALAERVGAVPPVVEPPAIRPAGGDEAGALNVRGVALARDGKLDEAADCFRRALKHQPDGPAAHNNLGNVLRAQGRLDQAAGHYERALRSNPDYAEAHNNLGIVRAEQGNLDEALACYDRALRCNPGFAEAHFNRGLALTQGNPIEAESSFRTALRLQPSHASAHYRLGRILADRGQVAAAVDCYGRALDLKADFAAARKRLALACLSLGDFERGLPLYEYRWQDEGLIPPTFPQPRWDGGPLAGRTILLHAEQGLGDTIQFIRYAPLIKRRGARVLVQCPKTLIRLLGQCSGIDELVPEGCPVPAFDVYTLLLGLPWLCQTRMETIPADVPYVFVNPNLSGYWNAALKDISGFKVGIAWQGSTQHKGDRLRSMPVRQFAPLAQVPGVRLLSLQKGFGTEQLAGIADLFPVHDLGPRYAGGDFADTAAIVQNLDLVVTPDTAVAHLAGALGVPVWVALPFASDWRWFRERADTPWYPTMRLFRQKVRDHWEPVFAEMAAALAERVGAALPAVAAVVYPAGGDEADALNDRGVALAREGKLEEAADCFRQSLARRPNGPAGHNNLGNVLRAQGRLDEAIHHFEEALRLNSAYAEAHNNLAIAFAQQGKLAEAIESCDRALSCNPDFADAYFNRGLTLSRQEKPAEAEASFRAAVRLQPNHAAALHRLGLVLADRQPEEAADWFRRSLQRRPTAQTYNGLGIVLCRQGKIPEALEAYRAALRLQPTCAEAHYNLGVAHSDQGQLDEAADHFQQALQIKPDYVEALTNLGNTYKNQGRLDEALECYRNAVHGSPDNAALHSNWLMAMLYHPRYSPATVFEEHLQWAARHAAPAAVRQPEVVERSPDRRLRIGYVSGDFRHHVMGFYTEPVVRSHDRSHFEITCYTTTAQADELTERIRAHADRWRSLVGLSDEEAVQMIRADAIDILIDLTGHTAHNRLPLFSRKPAPVQATHFGYTTTTGLQAMDYRITDAHADPPGMTDAFHTERLMRLPLTSWCYVPPVSPAIKPLPALSAGRVTFGSFNMLAKVTEAVIAVWSQVLHGVPNSRLLALSGAGNAADRRLIDLFAANGIGSERLTLVGRRSRAAYFDLYQDVDLCLDTFPFTGCNTTCDALWMGVPTVTLAGDSFRARQSVTVLSCVGLEDWIVDMPAGYVELATRFAGDLPRLAQLRLELRQRMAQSPMTDVAGFTRRLEDAYRAMWRRRMKVTR